MDVDRHSDLDPAPDGLLVEGFPALGHVGDGLAEAVMPRAAGFLEGDDATGCVLGNRSAAFGCCCRCSRTRSLCPGKRCDQCQRDAEYCLLHFDPSLSISLNRTPGDNPLSEQARAVLSYFG